MTLSFLEVMKSVCIKQLDEKFRKCQSYQKLEQMRHHLCWVLNTSGLDFPNKIEICEMLEKLLVAHETSQVNNNLDFSHSVCNIYVCFYRLLRT